MHHPGPPRFTGVGWSVELAPRDPDPEATYEWTIADAPADSQATLGDENVENFHPDVAGLYTIELDAPDGTHELTVRVFPSEKLPGGAPGQTGASGISGVSGVSGYSGVSGVSGRSGSGFGSGSALGSGLLDDEGDEDRSGRPRVTLDAYVDGDEVVVTADAKSAAGSARDDEALTIEWYVDDRDDLDPSHLPDDGSAREARIPVDAVTGRERIHAVAIGDEFSIADAVQLDETEHGVETVRLNEAPEWARESTIYEIYARSFTKDEGTLFPELEAKIPYFKELGVDTLWLTPILQNDDFDHGYNITDFFDIADDVGTREEFESFVDACHENDINVLFDLVLNHTAREHEYYQKALEDDPKYVEWYDWEDRENKQPGTYFGWKYIANLNTDNLEVRRFLLDVVDEWAPYVDGFRCDMAWALDHGFWKEVRERVKETQGRDFFLLDETIPYAAEFNEQEFDMHFDTTLYFFLREIGRGHKDAQEVMDAFGQRARNGFPDHATFLTYIENHDETRYIEECGRDEQRAAAAATFTVPGTPLIYAGQERGNRERRGKGIMNWEEYDEDLFAYYQDLIDTRDELDVLQGGDITTVEHDAESKGIAAFAREKGDDRVVVVLNFGPGSVPVTIEEAVDTTDLRTGEQLQARDTDAGIEISVDSLAILRSNA